MKRGLLTILGIGVGWLLGVNLMMVAMPFSDIFLDYDFGAMLGNTLLLGFPGIILLIIALVLSIRDDAGLSLYKGNF